MKGARQSDLLKSSAPLYNRSSNCSEQVVRRVLVDQDDGVGEGRSGAGGFNLENLL